MNKEKDSVSDIAFTSLPVSLSTSAATQYLLCFIIIETWVEMEQWECKKTGSFLWGKSFNLLCGAHSQPHTIICLAFIWKSNWKVSFFHLGCRSQGGALWKPLSIGNSRAAHLAGSFSLQNNSLRVSNGLPPCPSSKICPCCICPESKSET